MPSSKVSFEFLPKKGGYAPHTVSDGTHVPRPLQGESHEKES